MSGERGQIAVAGAGLLVLIALGGLLLMHLAGIANAGASAQRAADLAALAAARELAADPDAAAAALRRVAADAAAANGGRLTRFELLRDRGLPAGVEVSVVEIASGSAPAAGERHDPVTAVARAGVAYRASLDPTAFRPVEVGGLDLRGAIVAAAAAQLGWPYVWGGESRTEGGFDCSGLVGFAYAAAGAPLPGRPIAASLWTMARPVTAAGLAPGDLVFAGAPSGAPDHVGIYAGSGFVIVAPHRGAVVRAEPLSAGAWDGFGRILPGSAAPGEPPPGIAAAAAAGVPAHVLAAETALGLTADPATLADAMRAHGGDLAAALAEQLGSTSAAALVLRLASGPALGDRFAATVRLLPRPGRDPGRASAAGGPPAIVPAVPPPAGGSRVGALVDAALDGGEALADQVAHRSARTGVQMTAAVRTGARLCLTAATLLLPERLQDPAGFAGTAWDAAVATREAVAVWGTAGAAAGLLAARLSLAGAVVSAGVFGWQAAAADSTRDRVGYGLMAGGSVLTAAGLATAGTGLLAATVTGVVLISPVGWVLIGVGALAIGAGYLVRNPQWLRQGAGAVASGVRSLVDAIPTPPW